MKVMRIQKEEVLVEASGPIQNRTATICQQKMYPSLILVFEDSMLPYSYRAFLRKVVDSVKKKSIRVGRRLWKGKIETKVNNVHTHVKCHN